MCQPKERRKEQAKQHKEAGQKGNPDEKPGSGVWASFSTYLRWEPKVDDFFSVSGDS